MKKRILSCLILLAAAVSLLPAGARAADLPVSAMKTSEAGLSLIKQFEGYTQYAYADNSQWTIGYGVACNPDDYPDGITEEDADALLREKITYYEDSLNRYTGAYSIALTQSEFDALVSITFNVGISWINSSYRFWKMERAGLSSYSDNEIASALGVWCHVGSAISTNLLQRRIYEIRLFLYGDYTGKNSTNFRYIIYHGNGGSVDTDVMLYRENEPYGTLSGASRDGCQFAGWYTAQDGGQQVTAGDTASTNLNLYARWTGTAPSPGSFSDVSASDWYYTYVTALSKSNILGGYPDGTFRPKAIVTAGQALKLILLASGSGEQSQTDTHWASGYLTYALNNKYLATGEITNLDAGISRLKIARLAAKVLNLTGSDSATPFSDTADASVLALYQAGIFEGSIDASTGKRMFYPNAVITRAEMSKIIWKISMK